MPPTYLSEKSSFCVPTLAKTKNFLNTHTHYSNIFFLIDNMLLNHKRKRIFTIKLHLKLNLKLNSQSEIKIIVKLKHGILSQQVRFISDNRKNITGKRLRTKYA